MLSPKTIIIGILMLFQQLAFGEQKSAEMKAIQFQSIDVKLARVTGNPVMPVYPEVGKSYSLTWKVEIPARLSTNSNPCVVYVGHHLQNKTIESKYIPNSYYAGLPPFINAIVFQGEGVNLSDLSNSATCPLYSSMQIVSMPMSFTMNVVLNPGAVPTTYLPPAPARQYVFANGRLYIMELFFGQLTVTDLLIP